MNFFSVAFESIFDCCSSISLLKLLLKLQNLAFLFLLFTSQIDVLCSFSLSHTTLPLLWGFSFQATFISPFQAFALLFLKFPFPTKFLVRLIYFYPVCAILFHSCITLIKLALDFSHPLATFYTSYFVTLFSLLKFLPRNFDCGLTFYLKGSFLLPMLWVAENNSLDFIFK